MADDVPEKVRRVVYERDQRKCRWCGVTNAYSYAVHHVVYRSQGGQHTEENLILLCEPCHRLVHSNKGLYMPLLQELLVSDIPVTGKQLLRWRQREGLAWDRPLRGDL